MSISLYGLSEGDFNTGWSIFAAGGTQTIIPASNNLNEIVCIGVTNASAGSLNWSVDVFDGTTSQKLVDTEPVAAHVRATFELPVRLTAAQYVRVTSSGAGLNVFATYKTISRRTK